MSSRLPIKSYETRKEGSHLNNTFYCKNGKMPALTDNMLRFQRKEGSLDADY